MTSPGERIEQRVGQAIDEAIREAERGVATKWVLLIESVNPDGERGMWTLTSPDVMAWDTGGALLHALVLQVGQVLGRGEL
jgi:hypothetical protein